MPKASKADRMDEIQTLASDVSAEEFGDHVDTLLGAVASINEALTEIEGAAAEALTAHEERDWETRESAMETVNEYASALRDDHVPQARDSLDTLLALDLSARLEEIQQATDQIIDHIDHIM